MLHVVASPRSSSTKIGKMRPNRYVVDAPSGSNVLTTAFTMEMSRRSEVGSTGRGNRRWPDTAVVTPRISGPTLLLQMDNEGQMHRLQGVCTS